MNNIKIIIMFVLLSFLSCMRAEFIRTGEIYPPLSSSDEIQVFLSGKPEVEYTEIGILRVMGGSQEKRIEKAKDAAKKNGGNAIITKGTGEDGASSEGVDGSAVDGKTEGNDIQERATSYDIQEFIIARLLEKPSDKSDLSSQPPQKTENEDVINQFFEEDIAKKPEMTQESYRMLPRATYGQLIKDYASLKGEMFRGRLYPKKIYKVPASIEELAQKGDKLVLLSTKSGKNFIYLLTSEEALIKLKGKIKAKKDIDFVYTPVGAIQTKDGKSPVIKFVDEVIGADAGE